MVQSRFYFSHVTIFFQRAIFCDVRIAYALICLLFCSPAQASFTCSADDGSDQCCATDSTACQPCPSISQYEFYGSSFAEILSPGLCGYASLLSDWSDSTNTYAASVINSSFVAFSATTNYATSAVYSSSTQPEYLFYTNGNTIKTLQYKTTLSLGDTTYASVSNTGKLASAHSNFNEFLSRGPLVDFTGSNYAIFYNGAGGNYAPMQYSSTYHTSGLFDITSTRYLTITDTPGVDLQVDGSGDGFVPYFAPISGSGSYRFTFTNDGPITVDDSSVFLNDSSNSYTTLNNHGGLYATTSSNNNPLITPGSDFVMRSSNPISCYFTPSSSAPCVSSTATGLGSNGYLIEGPNATFLSNQGSSSSQQWMQLAGDCGAGTYCYFQLWDDSNGNSSTFDQVPYLAGSNPKYDAYVYASTVNVKPVSDFTNKIGTYWLEGNGVSASTITALDFSNLSSAIQNMQIYTPVTFSGAVVNLSKTNLSLTYPNDASAWADKTNYKGGTGNSLYFPSTYYQFSNGAIVPLTVTPTITGLTVSGSESDIFNYLRVSNKLGSSSAAQSTLTINAGGWFDLYNAGYLDNVLITLGGGTFQTNDSAGTTHTLNNSVVVLASGSTAIPSLNLSSYSGNSLTLNGGNVSAGEVTVPVVYDSLTLLSGSAGSINAANVPTIYLEGNVFSGSNDTLTIGSGNNLILYGNYTMPTLSASNATLTFDGYTSPLPSFASGSGGNTLAFNQNYTGNAFTLGSGNPLSAITVASGAGVSNSSITLGSGAAVPALGTGSGNSLTLDGGSLSGTISNNYASLIFTSGSAGSIDASSVATVTLQGNVFSGSGDTLTLSSGSNLILAGNYTMPTLSASNATLTFAGYTSSLPGFASGSAGNTLAFNQNYTGNAFTLGSGNPLSAITVASGAGVSNSSITLGSGAAVPALGSGSGNSLTLDGGSLSGTIPDNYSSLTFTSGSAGTIDVSGVATITLRNNVFSGSGDTLTLGSGSNLILAGNYTMPLIAASDATLTFDGYTGGMPSYQSGSRNNTLVFNQSYDGASSGASFALGDNQALSGITVASGQGVSNSAIVLTDGEYPAPTLGTGSGNSLTLNGGDLSGTIPANYSSLTFTSGSAGTIDASGVATITLSNNVFSGSGDTLTFGSGSNLVLAGNYTLPTLSASNATLTFAGYTSSLPGFASGSAGNTLAFNQNYTGYAFTLGSGNPLSAITVASGAGVSNSSITLGSGAAIPSLGSGSANNLIINGATFSSSATVPNNYNDMHFESNPGASSLDISSMQEQSVSVDGTLAATVSLSGACGAVVTQNTYDAGLLPVLSQATGCATANQLVYSDITTPDNAANVRYDLTQNGFDSVTLAAFTSIPNWNLQLPNGAAVTVTDSFCTSGDCSNASDFVVGLENSTILLNTNDTNAVSPFLSAITSGTVNDASKVGNTLTYAKPLSSLSLSVGSGQTLSGIAPQVASATLDNSTLTMTAGASFNAVNTLTSGSLSNTLVVDGVTNQTLSNTSANATVSNVFQSYQLSSGSLNSVDLSAEAFGDITVTSSASLGTSLAAVSLNNINLFFNNASAANQILDLLNQDDSSLGSALTFNVPSDNGGAYSDLSLALGSSEAYDRITFSAPISGISITLKSGAQDVVCTLSGGCTGQQSNSMTVDGLEGDLDLSNASGISSLTLTSGSLGSVSAPFVSTAALNSNLFTSSSTLSLADASTFSVSGDYVLPVFTMNQGQISLSGYTGPAPTFAANQTGNTLHFASSYTGTDNVFAIGSAEGLTGITVADNMGVSDIVVTLTSGDVAVPSLGTGSGNSVSIAGAQLQSSANFSPINSANYDILNFDSGSYDIKNTTVTLPDLMTINLNGPVSFPSPSDYRIKATNSVITVFDSTSINQLVTAISAASTSTGNSMRVNTDIDELTITLGSGVAFSSFASNAVNSYLLDHSRFTMLDGSSLSDFSRGLSSQGLSNQMLLNGLGQSDSTLQALVNHGDNATVANVFGSYDINSARLDTIDLVKPDSDTFLPVAMRATVSDLSSVSLQEVSLTLLSTGAASQLLGTGQSLITDSSSANTLSLASADTSLAYSGLSISVGEGTPFDYVGMRNATLSGSTVTLTSGDVSSLFVCETGSCGAGNNTLVVAGASGELTAAVATDFTTLSLQSGSLTNVDASTMASGSLIDVQAAFVDDSESLLIAEDAVVQFTDKTVTLPVLSVVNSTISLTDGYAGSAPVFTPITTVVSPMDNLAQHSYGGNMLSVSSNNRTASSYHLGSYQPYDSIDIGAGTSVSNWSVNLHSGVTLVPQLSTASSANSLYLDGADFANSIFTVPAAYSLVSLNDGVLGSSVSFASGLSVSIEGDVSFSPSSVSASNVDFTLNTPVVPATTLLASMNTQSSNNTLNLDAAESGLQIDVDSQSSPFSLLNINQSLADSSINQQQGGHACFGAVPVTGTSITLGNGFTPLVDCDYMPSQGSANDLSLSGAKLSSVDLILPAAVSDFVYNSGSLQSLTTSVSGQALTFNAAPAITAYNLSGAEINWNTTAALPGITGTGNALIIGVSDYTFEEPLALGDESNFSFLSLANETSSSSLPQANQASVSNTTVLLSAGGELPNLPEGANTLSIESNYSAASMRIAAGFSTVNLGSNAVQLLDLTAVTSPVLYYQAGSTSMQVAMQEGTFNLSSGLGLPIVTGSGNTLVFSDADNYTNLGAGLGPTIEVGPALPITFAKTVSGATVIQSSFLLDANGKEVNSLDAYFDISGSDNALVIQNAVVPQSLVVVSDSGLQISSFRAISLNNVETESLVLDSPGSVTSIGQGVTFTATPQSLSSAQILSLSEPSEIDITSSSAVIAKSSGHTVIYQALHYGMGTFLNLAKDNTLMFDLDASDPVRIKTFGSQYKWNTASTNGGTIYYDNPGCIIYVPEGVTVSHYDQESCSLLTTSDGVYESTAEIFGHSTAEVHNRLGFAEYGVTPYYNYMSKGKGNRRSVTYDSQSSGAALLLPWRSFDVMLDASYARYIVDTGARVTQKSLYLGVSNGPSHFIDMQLVVGGAQLSLSQDVVLYGDETLVFEADAEYNLYHGSIQVTKPISLPSIQSVLEPSIIYALQKRDAYSLATINFGTNTKSMLMPKLALRNRTTVRDFAVDQSLFTLLNYQLSGGDLAYSYQDFSTTATSDKLTSAVFGYQGKMALNDNFSLLANSSFSSAKVFTIGLGVNYNFIGKHRPFTLSHIPVSVSNSSWTTITN